MFLAAAPLLACNAPAYDRFTSVGYGESAGTGDDSTSSSLSEGSTAGSSGFSDLPPSSTSTGGEGGTTGAPIAPPSIVGLELPLEVQAAGPMQVQVHARHTATAELTLDGAQTFPLVGDGDGDGDGVQVFSGVVPIHGSADQGPHVLTATARREDLQDSVSKRFTVTAPSAGVFAWERFGGAGSRTTRLAVTPGGEVYEAGAFEINGLARPAVRLREPLTGADLWAEGARVLDVREGAVADLDLAPDGRVWIAMNVLEGDTWIARIAAFSPEMDPLGLEQEKPYATVEGVASDSASGHLAVGFGTSLFGDKDLLTWRMTAAGAPILSGYPWDYAPSKDSEHSFDDFAFDVVIDRQTDEAWIVGGTQGEHEGIELNHELRGLLMHIDIDTLQDISPVFVVPPAGAVRQSVFYSVWLEPESVLVSGYQCDAKCLAQSVLATRYDFAGVPTWGYSSPPTTVAIGHGIASDSHGTVLIAAAIQEDMLLRGYLLGRTGASEAFAPVAFPGTGTSSAASVVVGPYDWPFTGGKVTKDGVVQGYVMHTHP